MENPIKEGDTIEWSFDSDSPYKHFAGKTFQAKVAIIDDEGYCGVYAEYGQDFIHITQAKKIINGK